MLIPAQQSRQTFSVGESLKSLNCAYPARTSTMLTLKRASKSRPIGEWSDDDYDVFDGDRHIGRISCGRTRLSVAKKINELLAIKRLQKAGEPRWQIARGRPHRYPLGRLVDFTEPAPRGWSC